MGIFFPKPQPLSPASNVVLENGNYYIAYKNGKKRRVRGVPYAQSIYFLWFEYLKRSEKYKKACANNGRGMKKLYNDFGDVFAYKGERGFWTWWKERGDYLFGVRTGFDAERVTDWQSLLDVEDLFEAEQVTILILPNDIPKTKLLKAAQKLIRNVPLAKPFRSQANYLPQSVKIDVESLRDCLTAYDLRQQGCSNLEIGAYLTVSANKTKDLLEDGRKNYADRDYRIAEIDHLKNIKLSQHEYDAMIDEEIDSSASAVALQRTKQKNYLNMKASRMIRKALANIAGVERGEFPIGHQQAAKSLRDS